MHHAIVRFHNHVPGGVKLVILIWSVQVCNVVIGLFIETTCHHVNQTKLPHKKNSSFDVTVKTSRPSTIYFTILI